MGKNKKNDCRGTMHIPGSYVRKVGPKRARGGNVISPAKLQQTAALNKANWNKKIAAETMDGGEARMALFTTLKVIEEADLKFDTDAERVHGLHSCFERAGELTGSTPATLKRLFDSLVESDSATYTISDTSKRGRGSDEVDKESLYKIKPDQAAAIRLLSRFRTRRKAPRRSLSTRSPSTWRMALTWALKHRHSPMLFARGSLGLRYADVDHNPDGGATPKGVSGTLGNLLGADGWTQSDVTCLDIPDMAVGDDADIGEALGAQAVVIAQGDIEVAAAHLGGADS